MPKLLIASADLYTSRTLEIMLQIYTVVAWLLPLFRLLENTPTRQVDPDAVQHFLEGRTDIHPKEYAAYMALMQIMASQFLTCSVTKLDTSYRRIIDIKSTDGQEC